MPDRTQHIDYEAAVKARGGFYEAGVAMLRKARFTEGAEAAHIAYAAAACERAEQAIFHAFNILASYTDDEEAGRVVHLRAWEPEWANEPEPPAFVTESVERCVAEVEQAVAKIPVIANAKVGTVHGTSDGGWRVEVRINNQVFAPRFDTLDKATEYRREAAEIVERAA